MEFMENIDKQSDIGSGGGPEKKAGGWRDLNWTTIIISAVVLTVLLLTISFMMDIALLTFLFTFIFYALLKVTRKGLDRTPLRRMPDSLLLVILYILGFALVGLCGAAFTSVIVSETTNIANSFINFDYNTFIKNLDPRVGDVIYGLNVNTYLDRVGETILDWLASVGKVSVNIIMAIALSLLLLLEKRKIHIFGMVCEKSRISSIYRYIISFGANFCKTFGKVMKVQVLIAFVNGVLSVILLAILGFSNIWGLGVMIFLLGLVPVAGVIISLVPLTIIAFNLGGMVKVIQILVMVAVIHAIEAYILNPKLMASRTELPVSFVFIILLVAEYYLHIWGLLVGIPLFIFLMTIFEVKFEDAMEHERKKNSLFLKLKSRLNLKQKEKSPPQ